MKEQFIKTVEQLGYEVKLNDYDKDNYIRIEIKEKSSDECFELFCDFFVHCSYISWKMNYGFFACDDACIKACVDFLKSVPQNQDHYLLLQFTNILYAHKEKALEKIQKSGICFKHPFEIEAKELKKLRDQDSTFYDVNYYITQNDMEHIASLTPFIEELDQTIAQCEEKELLFKYQKKHDFLYWFYIEGQEEKIESSISPKGFTLKIGEEIVSINEKGQMQEFFSSYIEKVKKKRRIKNVLNPPTYFYDKWIEVDRDKAIYQSLSRYLTPIEIEEFAATMIKNGDEGHHIEEEEWLFFYQEKVILFSMNDKKVFVCEKNDTWKETISLKLAALKKERVDNQLKDIS